MGLVLAISSIQEGFLLKGAEYQARSAFDGQRWDVVFKQCIAGFAEFGG